MNLWSGGIVGLATAHRLLESKPDLKIALFEKENMVSMHQTGNNSVLAVNAGCNLSSAPSAPYSLSLFTLPDVTASVSPNPTCTGDSVVFQAQGALTYQWNNGIVNGVPVSIATSGSFNVVGLDAKR